MRHQITSQNTNTQNIDVIATKIDYIQQDVSEIKIKLEAHYVTRDEFDPIKKVVYGIVSVVLLTVVGAIITLVLRVNG